VGASFQETVSGLGKVACVSDVRERVGDLSQAQTVRRSRTGPPEVRLLRPPAEFPIRAAARFGLHGGPEVRLLQLPAEFPNRAAARFGLHGGPEVRTVRLLRLPAEFPNRAAARFGLHGRR
jgi:hypothetical protein